MMMNQNPNLRRLRGTLAVSLVFCASAWTNGCKKEEPVVEKPDTVVQAVHPEVGPISEEITADAVLAPVAQAAILPKVAAPVRTFYVQRGSRVKAGQVVATLENGDLQAAAIDNAGAYTAAKGTFTAATQGSVPEEQTRARLDLEQAKSTLDLDNSILESRRQLLAQGAIPGRDFDTAKSTALQAKAAYDLAMQKFQSLQKSGTGASLESARGQLESARGKYLGAQAQLGYASVRTPISGVVTDRTLFAGETPAAGVPLLTVMDTSSMIAKLHIAQVQAQTLKVGSPATIKVPGLDEEVTGKVSLISPALDPGSTTVEVWLKLANPHGTLKAGTPAIATLKGRNVPDGLLVPSEAVQRSTEGEGKIVMVIGADGKSKKQAVMVGVETKEKTQILSGLTAGDTVITGGGYGLDEGTKVKIGPAESKDAADDATGGDKSGSKGATD